MRLSGRKKKLIYEENVREEVLYVQGGGCYYGAASKKEDGKTG